MNSVLRAVNFLKLIGYLNTLLLGLFIYAISKKTPAFGYQSMIKLFCLTGGRSNDCISSAINLIKPPYFFDKPLGILGCLDNRKRMKITSELRIKGYYIFKDTLSEEVCDRLLKFALSSPCEIRRMDGENDGPVKRGIYVRGNPEAVRYEFTAEDLLINEDVQNLLSDLSFAVIAQDYLGSRPVVDVLGMWWHTAFSDMPDKVAAQHYHFDMDRPKWIKFFIYLTDVGPNNGPHSFVTGSHKTGGIPSFMLKEGYVRLDDSKVEGFYGANSIREFSAKKGTIIAEDTRGLHKGKHVEYGDRLIFQLQYSNCLFGGSNPKAYIPNDSSEKLKKSIRDYPEIFQEYL